MSKTNAPSGKPRVSLISREQRKKLAARDTPYYQAIGEGISIGYRKGKLGATWSVRQFKLGKYVKREIGRADDTLPADGMTVLTWQDALKIATDEPARTAAFAAKYSVEQCVSDYLQHRRAIGRSLLAIKNDEGTLKWFLDKFGSRQVSDLSTSDLQRWRDGLVIQPAAEADLTEAQRREQLRASQASANRFWTACRAALNFAFTTGRVDADLAWRRVKPFQGVDQARTRFLSVAECNKLLRACPTHFGNLAQAALLTGLRPGELVRLTVEQFKGTRLEVAAGKGKLRYVPLTRAGQAFFKKLAKGRQPGDLVLPNSEGGNWTPMQIARAMRAAVTGAKIPPAVFYDLRRSYGSLLANAGAGLSIIANALGHVDTRMTKRHYAHLLDSVVAAELQDKLPTFRTRNSRRGAAGNGESAVRRPGQPA
jgi:integrase